MENRPLGNVEIIMEDRYEICGKIGQGGLGSVYRGHDLRMNREVAIKRILPTGVDKELQEESTRQLIKEAGALASLQHPHIVTIYDVGSDEDGPYVVMELITGKTLDELIERAPLTWGDFRELAMQTQEALIAAHELNLIHSDLKPSNLMLTWLPSGKFQVKIVDFGLATLAQSQSKQELESIDTVFGSIFFMPPEQFERNPLDARSDLYSIGCVYYQALTGTYPFTGQTGPEVTEAHLNHVVKPLKEVRAGIPVWACDWIMWHLNRFPQDRPQSARDALSLFLQNDRIPDPAMSTGLPTPVAGPPGPPRPRLVIPGSKPPVTGQGARANPTLQAITQASLVKTGQVNTMATEAAHPQAQPQALLPPEGFKPSVHTSQQGLLEQEPSAPAPAANAESTSESTSVSTSAARPTHPVRPAAHAHHHVSKKQKLIFTLVFASLLATASLFLWKMIRQKRDTQGLTEMLALVETPGTTTMKIDNAKLRFVLAALLESGVDSRRQSICKVLILAEATDGTDVDMRIVEFLTQHPQLPLGTKEELISKVLAARNRPVILPRMLEIATNFDEPTLAISALLAVRQLAGDDQFDTFLNILTSTSKSDIRSAAEINLEVILRKTRKLDTFSKQLQSAQESNIKPDIQKALKRLQGVCRSIPPQTR
jgi:serine/threonine protein kinase